MKYIYLIELKSNKYYVELSNKIINDLKTDFFRFNYPWTRKYEPVKIIEIIMIEDCDINKLDEFVEKYMSIYGMENVRGGKYDSIILENENEKLKLKLIDNNYVGDNKRNDNSLIKVWFCNYCGQDFTNKELAIKHEENCHKKYNVKSNDNCCMNFICCL
tara:strand:- start:198 stop:677 length:480 start_codon:yes stop_codon:yes gene_type:complete